MAPLGIAHLTTFLQGGAGRAIVDLARAQRDAGHDVVVLTSDRGQPGYGNYPHYLDQLRDAGVPLLVEDSLFTRDQALNRRALARLRAERPRGTLEVVHAHAGTPARIARLYAAAEDHGVAVIQTQHGWGVAKTPEQAREDLAVLDEVDRIVVTSEATRSLLAARGVPRGRVETIPCGIAGTAPRSVPEDAVRTAAELRARGLRVVGCIGTVNANKNQRLLIDALARPALRDAAAIVVGEGGEAVAAQARGLGLGDRVRAVGYQPDADRWLPAFDVLAVPSLTEGQGLVVLEAFRAGVPVAASAIAALAQLVTDGEHGWLFDPHDADALARTLTVALRLPEARRDAVRMAARRRFDQQYTIPVMLARHEALYRRVIADRSHGTRVA
jgi:glycosyltransferase involved in cell wall biosynthesis